MLELIGAIIALTGAFFLLLASLGLIRMPDVYNRMQAGTKATTLGSILIFLGVGLFAPLQWPRLLVLIVFIFLTNPLSSHALARSAHFQGIPVILPDKAASSGIARDDLAETQAEARKESSL
jgi:multicomponent Na+:H+ antiporter subunit G